jgi:hypothetical protein
VESRGKPTRKGGGAYPALKNGALTERTAWCREEPDNLFKRGELMKLKTLLVIHAVVALVYGISFELVPALVLSIYGVTQGPAETLMARYFGVELIAVGLLCWFARNVADALARRAIILAVFISDIVGVIVSGQGTLSGAMNAVGWTAVGLYLLFALGFGYMLTKQSSPE